MLNYRLPQGKGKSSVHERLFGRKIEGRISGRKGGILNRYVESRQHGELWILPRNLPKVTSILQANNVFFALGRRPRKRSSISRSHRRYRAKLVEVLREGIGSLDEDRATKVREQLAKLRPGPEKKEWYLGYCRGEAIGYVRGHVKRLKTVVKMLRSAFRKRAIDASELELELFEFACSEEITDRRKAERLRRLAHQLKLTAVEELVRWKLERR